MVNFSEFHVYLDKQIYLQHNCTTFSLVEQINPIHSFRRNKDVQKSETCKNINVNKISKCLLKLKM